MFVCFKTRSIPLTPPPQFHYLLFRDGSSFFFFLTRRNKSSKINESANFSSKFCFRPEKYFQDLFQQSSMASCKHCSHTLTLMRNLSQPVFPFLFSAVSDAIIIKIHQILAVSAWIHGEGDWVHFALRIELPDVLL